MTDDYGEVSLAEWCQANCYVLMSVNKSTQYLLSSGKKKKKKSVLVLFLIIYTAHCFFPQLA